MGIVSKCEELYEHTDDISTSLQATILPFLNYYPTTQTVSRVLAVLLVSSVRHHNNQVLIS